MTDQATAFCPNGHPNRGTYSFCIKCGAPLAVVPVQGVGEPLTGGPAIFSGINAASDPPSAPGASRRLPRTGVIIAVVVFVLGAAGAVLGISLGHHGRSSHAAGARSVQRSTPSPSSSPSTIASGPTLTWSGYDGVYLGESLGDASTVLNGSVGYACPSDPGTMVVTGLPKDVVVSNRVVVHGAGAFNVNVIQLLGGNAQGPDGIKAGMTIAQARAASGQPLKATVSPTTGQKIYAISKGNAVFEFYGDPLVSDLTLTTPAGIQQGVLGGGGNGC